MDRLLAIWDRTTAIEREAGAAWYANAHAFCDSLAFWTDLPLERVVAATAALSPQLSWQANRVAIERLVKGEPVPAVLGRSLRKAWRILHGQFPQATAFPLKTCPKTNAFYHNILTPSDTRYVTIDRHAATAAVGQRVTRFDYWELVDWYKRAAFTVCVPPTTFQATIWEFVRNHGQMSFEWRS